MQKQKYKSEKQQTKEQLGLKELIANRPAPEKPCWPGQFLEREKFLATKNELLDQIAILLGGRVAEEIIFSDVSTGAQNDLGRSSELA